MRHRRLILALFVLATVITGTAGYSAIQAERSVDVTVADDGNAYLAVENQNNSVENGSTEGVLSVTNQFGREVELTVDDVETTGSVEYDSVDGATSDVTLSADEQAMINASCTGTDDGELEVMVFVESDDNELSVRTMQVVEISCTSN
ncbi:hypothetical protein EXE46_15105 [Halorubrum sp. GN11_10-6_MGM]|uniref:hypothetical protein n=1 Tax=Halorubrum sp. GN11_10-6_MGM TaxID=2518112 RepID=UPI0010F79BF5|nr:hypothetical protein [Halorubrum sp. GN11_10-6_MGM]TKX72910.1 hypothetical protein EXE46_15105 [Halorubrum sp. GN11_10-6_MGM]